MILISTDLSAFMIIIKLRVEFESDKLLVLLDALPTDNSITYFFCQVIQKYLSIIKRKQLSTIKGNNIGSEKPTIFPTKTLSDISFNRFSVA